MTEFGVLAFTLLLAGLSYTLIHSLASRLARRQNAPWQRFAESTQLTLQTSLWGLPCVIGTYRGYWLRIERLMRKNRYLTEATLIISNPANISLSLSASWISPFVNLIYTPKVEISSRSFNEVFRVKGTPLPFIQKLLNNERFGRELVKVYGRTGKVELKIRGEKLSYKEGLGWGKPSDLNYLADLLSDFADEVKTYK